MNFKDSQTVKCKNYARTKDVLQIFWNSHNLIMYSYFAVHINVRKTYITRFFFSEVFPVLYWILAIPDYL